MKVVFNHTLFVLFSLLLSFPLAASESNGEERILYSSGSKWEELAAYSRAVVDGDWIFVSGTAGINHEDNSIAKDFDQQMDQIFINIESALTEVGAELADLVRVRCYIVDSKYVVPMSKKLQQYLGEIRPANLTIVSKLAVDGALIEIEATALKRKK